MRKKQHLLCGPLCSFPLTRALRCLYFPSVFSSPLLSFLSLLSLPKQRTDSAVPNAKEQKMENILLLFLRLLRCSHHEAFSSRVTEAVLLTPLQNNQMKQKKEKRRKKERNAGRKKTAYDCIMVKQSSSQSSLYIQFFFQMSGCIKV